ncbi:MAG: hypothetical protein HFE63_05610 [Clostridiales bacterium]|nr:hypothetical protein [Clostridiales bacterium]
MKNLTVRLDNEMLDKLHYIADYEGRSANGQAYVLIRQCIENFEKQQGEIPISKRKGSAEK